MIIRIRREDKETGHVYEDHAFELQNIPGADVFMQILESLYDQGQVVVNKGVTSRT